MANIQPTVDDLDQSTVMLQIRKIAGAVDSNLEAVNAEMANIQEQIGQMEDVSGRVTTLENEMDTVQEQINQMEDVSGKVTVLETEMDSVQSDLTAVKSKNTKQDTAISDNDSAIQNEISAREEAISSEVTARQNADITGASLSVVSGAIQLMLNRTLGAINANVTAPFIKTMELVPTATERAFKVRITYWNNTQYDTNDFVIPAGGGTDVSVTGVTIQDGTSPNSFQVQIELSDGTPISSNDYSFPESDNIYPTSITLGLSGTTLSVNIGLNNSTSVSNTVDLAPLLKGYATQTWVNGQLANYATDTEVTQIQSNLQQQITSISPTVTTNLESSPPTITVAVNGKSSTANLPNGSNFTHTITGNDDTELKSALQSLPLYTVFTFKDSVSNNIRYGTFQKVNDDYYLGTGIQTINGKNFPFAGFLLEDIWTVGQLNYRQDDGVGIFTAVNNCNSKSWTINY